MAMELRATATQAATQVTPTRAMLLPHTGTPTLEVQPRTRRTTPMVLLEAPCIQLASLLLAHPQRFTRPTVLMATTAPTELV